MTSRTSLNMISRLRMALSKGYNDLSAGPVALVLGIPPERPTFVPIQYEEHELTRPI